MAEGHADDARRAAPGWRDRVAALLELAAADNAAGFRAALDAAGDDVDELADGVEVWYGRRSKAYEPRTPLMVAAACGSAAVVALLLGSGRVDVNRRPGVDGATALHCAASGGSPNAVAVVRSLLASAADRDAPDAAGRVPADVVNSSPDASAVLKALLSPRRQQPAAAAARPSSSSLPPPAAARKEYPADPTLPDLGSSAYTSDEFRMFVLKVRPCGRAYAHDWTECPFLHPGENARRRDPRRHAYTALPCASFRLAGGCPRGDACDFAHGVFETWLHPSLYRTSFCRDGAACARRICFFAHDEHELRRLSRDGAAHDMAAAPALGGVAPSHWIEEGSMLPLRFPEVDELGALLDFASLSRSQPGLAHFRRPSPTYMALPPSRFGNDHDAGSVYSPEDAKTSQLLARIRQQQGLRLPSAVMQRQVFDRPFSSPNKKQHQVFSPGVGSPAWGPDAPTPNSKIDWSFGAEEHRYFTGS